MILGNFISFVLSEVIIGGMNTEDKCKVGGDKCIHKMAITDNRAENAEKNAIQMYN